MITRPTQEDRNLSLFHQALSCEDEPPLYSTFAPLGDFHDLCFPLYESRLNDGVDGYRKALSRLTQHLKQRTPTQERFFAVLCEMDATFETMGISPYYGTLMSEVQPKAIRWLWKPRLALGMMTMFDGDPSLGKSILTTDFIARLTRGVPFPGNEKDTAIQGGAVIINTEDPIGEVIQPRLARANADLSQVSFLGQFKEKDGTPHFFSLERDVPKLLREIERVKAKLVIIDPIMTVIGGNRDIKQPNAVNEALMPLHMLAEQTGVCCLLLRHVTKQAHENALYRGQGSMSFIGLCRTAIMAMQDKDEEGRNLLAHIKTNIYKYGEVLAYRIVNDELSGDERPYIKWEGATAHTIKDLMSPTPGPPSEERQALLAFLDERYPKAFSPVEIAKELGVPEEVSAINMTLSRMLRAKQVDKPSYGKYAAKKPGTDHKNLVRPV